ncbi:LOW QUALITY PROTEIN: hypothetical protein PanWU01x14_327580 [Parasponia andersonii]|uniref:Uncharacterized protein n=1 Tax=Parasponia andersonii TaxID=3476 RepID=A0A2P5AJ04_PARAD|nr:LOW QUALITY PROTEIN: hypothetical protein PanWU01x14_327580 [Parasponia andersonii]
MNQEANHLTTDLEENGIDDIMDHRREDEEETKTVKGRGDSLLLLRLLGCFLRHCRPRLRLTELVEPEQLVVLSRVSTNPWTTYCVLLESLS